ncbi:MULTISPECIES: ribose-5-phosphate isomerase A [Flagellimonas]|uniref:Uncharacterized protein n=1 Tax=Flagellimonas hadalis TaxID=2597517 RepID=A0A5N5IMW7_9FLAO|nr:hypothetical protein FOT42_011060 [Allomuricauda hadalis]
MGLNPMLWTINNKEFRTDHNNTILDLNIWGPIDIESLQAALAGIVETGLFLDTTDLVIMGIGNETITFQ